MYRIFIQLLSLYLTLISARITVNQRRANGGTRLFNIEKRSFIGPKLHRVEIVHNCNAISRTGVCVPEDIGLYGRTMFVYECLYTKDGRTQTGDEWEDEMVKEGLSNYNQKVKLRKMKKIVTTEDEPDAGFKQLIFPPPLNTTGMLLREGEPYLVISSWVPGISKENINVLIDYTFGPVNKEDYTDFKKMKDVSSIENLDKYYSILESLPQPEQHPNSYNSTYNDLFNRMHANGFNFFETYDNVTRPPMIFLSMPKNTVVKQWERATFSTRRDPKTRLKYSRIQRAYRPLAHIDLRYITCIYKDGTLQLRLKLTHIQPPPDSNHIYKIPISSEGTITEPRVYPKQSAHGWMYNWHYFKEYDLDFDLSKLNHTLADATYIKPVFVDDMTPRQVGRFIREVDELEKKINNTIYRHLPLEVMYSTPSFTTYRCHSPWWPSLFTSPSASLRSATGIPLEVISLSSLLPLKFEGNHQFLGKLMTISQ